MTFEHSFTFTCQCVCMALAYPLGIVIGALIALA